MLVWTRVFSIVAEAHWESAVVRVKQTEKKTCLGDSF
jgi:hypothetical protein